MDLWKQKSKKLKDYENWGCEFLEKEIEYPIYSKKNNWFYLPITLIDKIVDKKYIENLKLNDKERLHFLYQDVNNRGLIEPGTITISNSLVSLTDGNHRYLVCKGLGYLSFPINFKYTDGKILNGVKMKDIFADTLVEMLRG